MATCLQPVSFDKTPAPCINLFSIFLMKREADSWVKVWLRLRDVQYIFSMLPADLKLDLSICIPDIPVPIYPTFVLYIMSYQSSGIVDVHWSWQLMAGFFWPGFIWSWTTALAGSSFSTSAVPDDSQKGARGPVQGGSSWLFKGALDCLATATGSVWDIRFEYPGGFSHATLKIAIWNKYE